MYRTEMDPWLDSLSEDWISQQGSSSFSPANDHAAERNGRSTPETEDSSRSPCGSGRLASDGDSAIHHEVPSEKAQASRTSSEKFGGALAERSPNSARRKIRADSTEGDRKSANDVVGAYRGRRPSSTKSALRHPNAQTHTVNRVSVSSSPQKNRRALHTPEWKRRLRDGGVGHQNPQDLFSHVGLESLFQPPPARSQALSHPCEPIQDRPKAPDAEKAGMKADTEADKSTQSGHKKGQHQTGEPALDRAIGNTHSVAMEAVSHPRPSNRDNKYAELSSPPVTRVSEAHLDSHLGEAQGLPAESVRTRDVSRSTSSANRSTSGVDDENNEDITPIFISKQNTIDGGVNYAALDLSPEESLQSRMIPTNHGENAQTRSLHKKTPVNSLAVTELRHRRSTPQSHHRSVPLAATGNPLRSPKTPPPATQLGHGKTKSSKSSASPLKLFGDYDTFTNERLLQRMNQFESVSKGNGSGSDYQVSTPSDTQSASGSSAQLRSSDFGHGDLDHSQFTLRSQALVVLKSAISDGPAPDGPVEPGRRSQIPKPVSHKSQTRIGNRHRLHRSVAPIGKGHGDVESPSVRLEPAKDISAGSATRNESDVKRGPPSPMGAGRPKRRRTLVSSELNQFPSHEDGPKIPNLTNDRPLQVTDIVGKKRKDACYENQKRTVEPDVMAMRKILRPRQPTPKNTKRLGDEPVPVIVMNGQSKIGGNGPDLDEGNERDFSNRAKNPVLGEVKSSEPQIGGNPLSQPRKGSIQTQDFLNEAEKIMELIRAKGTPQGKLAQLLELESDGSEDSMAGKDNFEARVSLLEEGSTQDRFSRPPSRERATNLTSGSSVHVDPRVTSYLNQYAEPTELDIITNPSLQSLKYLETGIKQTREAVPQQDKSYVENHQLKIRITETSSESTVAGGTASSSKTVASKRMVPETLKQTSKSSSNISPTRTIHTGSSSQSESRRVIAPHVVSHLVSGEIAGMTYDETKQAWVRRKQSALSPAKPQKSIGLDESEEDPFQDIPDLSVDEFEELQRIRNNIPLRSAQEGLQAKQNINEGLGLPAKSPVVNEFCSELKPKVESNVQVTSVEVECRPTSLATDPLEEELAVKFHPHSKGEPPKRRLLEVKASFDSKVPPGTFDRTTHEVEEEKEPVEVNNGSNPGKDRPSGRELTVTFSSPLASRRMRAPFAHSSERGLPTSTDIAQLKRDGFILGQVVETNRSWLCHNAGSREVSFGILHDSTSHLESGCVPFGLPSAHNRSEARAEGTAVEASNDSREKSSIVARRRSVGVLLSTPLRRPESWAPKRKPGVPTTSKSSNMTFHLSPLPDFTVNQLEETVSLDVTHVGKRRGALSAEASKRAFSLAAEELLKRLTDLEPYEPYWEYIRQLNLSGKRLITLHGLNDFCWKLEELDVSNNEIGQLSGLPLGVRHLKIAHNCLSSLTPWGHLQNLQYLDISNNEMDSLRGLHGLVHLRELKADNNSITSLDGVLGLDGLIKLNISRNALKCLDFAGSNL